MIPLVTVIIPVYNAETHISACLESILRQEWPTLEVIVVDDGSTDRSAEEVRACNDQRVRLLQQQNAGVSAARNHGIRAARGMYIAFVDADDELADAGYEAVMNTALTTGAQLVTAPYVIVQDERETVSPHWDGTDVLEQAQIRTELMPALLNRGHFSLEACFNKLYRRDLLEGASFDETRSHGEDVRLNLELLERAERIAFVPLPFYRYMIREAPSLTRGFREDLFDYYRESRDFGIELCRRYELPELIDHMEHDFALYALAYLEEAAAAPLPDEKKRDIAAKVLASSAFQDALSAFAPPSVYYRLLARTAGWNMPGMVLGLSSTKQHLLLWKERRKEGARA
ncbi:glycosyltransferase family 2 protein [Alkalicoccus chagannorensis]|uniref:glycosyltransferase family 2 protein n=1 Tax=Alkalicoccus chagannorensis TaxID=427072 RepID=UPI0003F5413C|nr:glycosyltransferase [Alkalicoccus chagannorensis]